MRISEDLINGKNIKKITLYNYYDEIIKAIGFKHEYFKSNSDCNTEDCKRLKLNEVYELSFNGITKTKYKFIYNETTNLPKRTSPEIDHWGYYNNSNEETLLPREDFIFNVNPIRHVNESATKANILTKIYNSLGGYTEFDYELNDYFESEEDKKAGGLRVKTVRKNDENGGEESLIYKYIENDTGISSGILYRFPHYSTSVEVEYQEDPGYTNICYVNMMYSSSVNHLYDLDGLHISYTEIKIEHSAAGEEINMFTNLESNPDIVNSNDYFSYSDGKVLNAIDPYGPPFAPPSSNRSWERGLLKERIVKDFSGRTITKTKNFYKQYEPLKSYNSPGIRAARVFNRALIPSSISGDIYYIGRYRETSLINKLDYSIEEFYDQNDAANTKKITTRTDYKYSPNLQVSEITKEDSEGNSRTTTYTYPSDYIKDCDQEYLFCSGDCMCGDPLDCAPCYSNCENQRTQCEDYVNNEEIHHAFDKMLKRHIISPVIEKQVWVNDNGTDKLLSADLTDYKMEGDIILPYKQLIFRANDGVETFAKTNIDNSGVLYYDNRYITETTFNDYDEFGNLLKQTSRNGTVTSYEYRYNNSLLTASTVNPGTSLAQRTEYVHKPLVGLVSTKDVNDFTTSYTYDKLNRLQTVKDQDGNIVRANRYFYANHKESIIADFSNDPAVSGKSTRFSAEVNNLLYGTTAYLWDFGDGSAVQESTSTTFNHTYTSSGIYNVKLMVKNPEYGQKEISKAVTVYSPLTKAVICTDGAVEKDICGHNPIYWGNCTENENPYTYTTSFKIQSKTGDGGCTDRDYRWEYKNNNGTYRLFGGNEPEASMEFFQVGTYYIRCRVSDNCGGSIYSNVQNVMIYQSDENCGFLPLKK